jgi:LmbE family N-acetylglucosaminyl deacetylase
MVLVVSPHLDDAVFSCGQLLAAHPGSVVVTALAGVPEVGSPVGWWDEELGFTSSHDVVLARREEDAGACAVLAAEPIWLDGLDGQYALPAAHDDRLGVQLADVLRAHRDLPLFLPLGIEHADHLKVARIGRAAARALGIGFQCYEELPYRVDNPGALADAIATLQDEGWSFARDHQTVGSREQKSAAIDRYASQEPHFPRSTLLAAERFHRVRAAGAEVRSR